MRVSRRLYPTSLTRLVLAPAMLHLAAGCHENITGPQRLEISGVVQTSGIPGPVAGATVRIDFVEPFGTRRQMMTTARTDAQGRYHLSIGRPPGFAHVNCAVLEVVASAPDYIELSLPLDWLITHEECDSGSATMDLELIYWPETP